MIRSYFLKETCQLKTNLKYNSLFNRFFNVYKTFITHCVNNSIKIINITHIVTMFQIATFNLTLIVY